jgi:hypothetical protein
MWRNIILQCGEKSGKLIWKIKGHNSIKSRSLKFDM